MEKGLKLLLETYWRSGRWRSEALTAEEFAQAKAEGYMFDPAPSLSHDETLHRLRFVLEKISAEDVVNAFLYSLSTRQLQYRSALGSYYYALAIPDHNEEDRKHCYFCNWSRLGSSLDGTNAPHRELSGYNIFNFERYKWGGVRHTHPEYALFDLEQFLLLPKVTPIEEDWAILRSILHAVKELQPHQKAGEYRELITKKKLLKSNKNEVMVLLNILGICGILSSAEKPCYCDRFANVDQRNPQELTNDYAYPVNWWRASNGVNKDRFMKVFGFGYSEL